MHDISSKFKFEKDTKSYRQYTIFNQSDVEEMITGSLFIPKNHDSGIPWKVILVNAGYREYN